VVCGGTAFFFSKYDTTCEIIILPLWPRHCSTCKDQRFLEAQVSNIFGLNIIQDNEVGNPFQSILFASLRLIMKKHVEMRALSCGVHSKMQE
jgi:hypothetical protein